ncbi:bifunctional riboflavin kinase/FAD synthetase [Caldicoprobacter algeriensis]|uniref:bifunctional riboflavin kinase/FAD synthetase n=1 Tax=Caldicoprobacter algeriensis TaxID=699281 RepID=UPI00207AF957|nr:bifunctional riboflavin kinase/FAD synthetase [Caldicoprobacter algeriensis]MCM8901168.1 bifunctional riboflavin kinase/FAD synthetase [Caldicoprobacter algeriensis]
MQVIFNEKSDHSLGYPVAIALGMFDGIHKGHKALIRRLKEIKRRYGYTAMVYTFKQHPLSCLPPRKAPPQIMNLNKKILEFHRMGVDILVLNNFDEGFARTAPREFIQRYLLEKYDVRFIVVGYNYRFGHNGSGDAQLLIRMGKEMGFEVVVVPPVKVGREVVSSSLIRKMIQQGDVAKAWQYLGRPYSINGQIVRGAGRGKTLGHPTANLDIGPKNIVIPKFGVYLTRCNLDGQCFWGVTNVGQNPTFDQSGLHIETFFLDYHGGELYGKHVRLYFLRYIREERRFPSKQELVQQMECDVAAAKNLIYKMFKV